MLGGVDPFLVFTFSDWIFKDAIEQVGIAVGGVHDGEAIFQDVQKSIGVPIPLYLSEKLTGIYVDGENDSMDVDTEVETNFNDRSKPVIWQRGINSLVTINMVAKRDSVVLAALLAFSDLIFQKLTAQNYTLSYFNGPTAIFGGLLHGFTTQVEPGTTNKMSCTLQIQKLGSPAAGGYPGLTLQGMIANNPAGGSGLGVGAGASSFPTQGMTIQKSQGVLP